MPRHPRHTHRAHDEAPQPPAVPSGERRSIGVAEPSAAAKFAAAVLLVAMPANAIASVPSPETFLKPQSANTTGETMPSASAQREVPAELSRLSVIDSNVKWYISNNEFTTLENRVNQFFRQLDAGSGALLRDFSPSDIERIQGRYSALTDSEKAFFRDSVIMSFAEAGMQSAPEGGTRDDLYRNAASANIEEFFIYASETAATAAEGRSWLQGTWVANVPVLNTLLGLTPTPTAATEEATEEASVAFATGDGETVNVSESQAIAALTEMGLSEDEIGQITAPLSMEESAAAMFMQSFYEELGRVYREVGPNGVVQPEQIAEARDRAALASLGFCLSTFPEEMAEKYPELAPEASGGGTGGRFASIGLGATSANLDRLAGISLDVLKRVWLPGLFTVVAAIADRASGVRTHIIQAGATQLDALLKKMVETSPVSATVQQNLETLQTRVKDYEAKFAAVRDKFESRQTRTDALPGALIEMEAYRIALQGGTVDSLPNTFGRIQVTTEIRQGILLRLQAITGERSITTATQVSGASPELEALQTTITTARTGYQAKIDKFLNYLLRDYASFDAEGHAQGERLTLNTGESRMHAALREAKFSEGEISRFLNGINTRFFRSITPVISQSRINASADVATRQVSVTTNFPEREIPGAFSRVFLPEIRGSDMGFWKSFYRVVGEVWNIPRQSAREIFGIGARGQTEGRFSQVGAGALGAFVITELFMDLDWVASFVPGVSYITAGGPGVIPRMFGAGETAAPAQVTRQALPRTETEAGPTAEQRAARAFATEILADYNTLFGLGNGSYAQLRGPISQYLQVSLRLGSSAITEDGIAGAEVTQAHMTEVKNNFHAMYEYMRTHPAMGIREAETYFYTSLLTNNYAERVVALVDTYVPAAERLDVYRDLFQFFGKSGEVILAELANLPRFRSIAEPLIRFASASIPSTSEAARMDALFSMLLANNFINRFRDENLSLNDAAESLAMVTLAAKAPNLVARIMELVPEENRFDMYLSNLAVLRDNPNTEEEDLLRALATVTDRARNPSGPLVPFVQTADAQTAFNILKFMMDQTGGLDARVLFSARDEAVRMLWDYATPRARRGFFDYALNHDDAAKVQTLIRLLPDMATDAAVDALTLLRESNTIRPNMLTSVNEDAARIFWNARSQLGRQALWEGITDGAWKEAHPFLVTVTTARNRRGRRTTTTTFNDWPEPAATEIPAEQP